MEESLITVDGALSFLVDEALLFVRGKGRGTKPGGAPR
jgi:hypothetical protein